MKIAEHGGPMKRMSLMSVLFLFLITSCAGIPPLKVKIKEEFRTDALREAHVRGMLLGYVSERLDYDKNIVVLIRKDPSMNMDLRLRIEIVEEDKVYVMRVEGQDMSPGGERYQLEGDMTRVALAVKECCGIDTIRKKIILDE